MVTSHANVHQIVAAAVEDRSATTVANSVTSRASVLNRDRISQSAAITVIKSGISVANALRRRWDAMTEPRGVHGAEG